MKKLTIYLFLLLLLGGCGANQIKLSTYNLIPQPSGAQNVGASLNAEVMFPKSPKVFTDTKMIYSLDDISMDTYAYSRWSDTPIMFVMRNILESCASSGVFKNSMPYPSKVASDIVVESDIIDFRHVIEKDSSFAMLSVRVYLIESDKGKSIEKLFSYKVACEETSPRGFALSMRKALEDFRGDLSGFIGERF